MDENRNLVVTNGDLVITPTSVEGIKQNIKQRLQTLKGEYFLDRTRGLPWFQIILRKNPNSNLVSTLFKETILNTEGVTKLNAFSLYFNSKTRKVEVTWEATVFTGEIINGEEVLNG